jgi:anthranilate/para-aminobenzoate synthase component I
MAKNILPKKMFGGGWVGYFSYELGRYIETLPGTTIDDLGMPLIRLCFYDGRAGKTNQHRELS